MTGPPMAPEQPQAPMPPPVMPWTPFDQLPTDTEPQIAAMRRKRLSKLIDTAKFSAMPKEWQQTAIMEYERMRQIEAQAAQANAQAQSSQASQPKQAGAAPQAPGAV